VKVVHVEAGRHLYGGPLQVVYLLHGLAGAGDRHALVCPVGSAIATAAREAADAVYPVPMGGDLDPTLVWRLLRLIRRERADLLHLHSRRGADLWGALAGRIAGVPVVLSRRVDNPESGWVARRKYRLYARVIAISEAIRGVLLSEGVSAERVVCVHSAVDTERYRPGCEAGRLARELGVSPDARRVGTVAQLIERKGHRVLLQAIPAVLARAPSAQFFFFGAGPLEGELRAEVARRGLSESVVFAGFRPDLDRILPCLDLLVHPARMEGLGVAVLQGAACALPVVACRAGGLPEIVRHGETGLLVPPDDAGALADAMATLLGDRELATRLGGAARERVLREFSIPAMVRGNRQVYRELLGARERASDA
jgi:glycosyltransferase involved in cell wall biosynthesis